MLLASSGGDPAEGFKVAKSWKKQVYLVFQEPSAD